jgi:DNA-binding transcriptional LysR family regulator
VVYQTRVTHANGALTDIDTCVDTLDNVATGACMSIMTSPPVGQQDGLDVDAASVDLRRVRYFVAVAEELHFTRAARRLGITQSSLSAAIQRLESEHGTPLLSRSTRRVALTEEGQRVLREARGLLRAADRFAAPPRRPAALRIGTCPPARVPLLDEIADEFMQFEFKGLVALREELSGTLLDALDAGEVDAVVTLATDAAGPGRHVERLATVPLQVALAPDDPRSERASVELGELSGMTLYVIGDEAAAGSRETALRACRAAGFEPPLHASPFAFSRPPLRSGEMFALMPALPGQPWASNVALVPLAEPAPTISFQLVWRDDHDPAVDAFICAARRVRARRGWVARS